MSVTLHFDIDPRRHADAVLGRDHTLPRAAAIQQLLAGRPAGASTLLQRVLDDDHDDADARRLAAAALWRLDTPEAREALLRAAGHVKDPVVLTGIVKALGRSGDARAAAAIAAATQGAGGVLARQAAFAQALLAHRLGLPGHELATPPDAEPLPPHGGQALSFGAPAADEAALFLRSMGGEPWGIEFDRERLATFTCSAGRWMVGFNRAVVHGAQPLRALAARKQLLGVLAARHNEDGRYAASFLILSAPRPGGAGVALFVTRTDGTPAWAGGTTALDATHAAFTLRTAGRVGVVPAALDGRLLADGTLVVEHAATGPRVAAKRHPRRLN